MKNKNSFNDFVRNKIVLRKVALFFVLVLSIAGIAVTADLHQASVNAAYAVYNNNEWIFYDPVNGGDNCDEKNYWTPYNTGTTCYRWFIVGEDSSANPNLKLLLDHNLDEATFDNYAGVLSSQTSGWNDYHGNAPRLLTEDEIVAMMKLEQPANDDVLSVSRPTPSNRFAVLKNVRETNLINSFLRTGTQSYINGIKTGNKSFWSQTVYNGDSFCPGNFSVFIVDDGVNSLPCPDADGGVRGVRPVIEVGKTKVKQSVVTDITGTLMNASYIRYGSIQGYDGLQGFTKTNNLLTFYVPSSDNPGYGLIYPFEGPSYMDVISSGVVQGEFRHGNDMTYDSDSGKGYIVDSGSVWILNGNSFQPEDTKSVEYIGGIGYDNVDRTLFAHTVYGLSELNADWTIKNSISVANNNTMQGMEYHNGYAYMTSVFFNNPCPNYYTFGCNREWGHYSGAIDVYNAKKNRDGTPSADFGKRVKQFYINGNSTGKIELESISFDNNEVWLGYSTKDLEDNPTNDFMRFYHFSDDSVEIPLETEVSYVGLSDRTIVSISSRDQLMGAEGWTLSYDQHEMTKEFRAQDISGVVTVCDYYNNCSDVEYLYHNDGYELTFMLSFDSNNGAGTINPVSCTTTGGSCSVTIPGATPTRNDYYFLGWADTKTATTATMQPEDTITITANKTIYAIWAPVYTLTYNLNDGDGTIDAQTCHPNTTSGSCSITISNTVPTRTNYTFLGWANANNATEAQYYPGQNITLSQNKTIFAAWKQNVTPPGPDGPDDPDDPGGTGEITWIQDQEHEKESNRNLIVKIDYPIEKFVSLMIDDEVVSVDNYTAIAGSTVISINSTYVDGLATGDHALVANYQNNVIAQTTFTITNAPGPGPGPTPEPDDPTPDVPSEPEDESDVLAPDTGKVGSGLGGAAATIAITTFMGLGVAGIMYYVKKRKNEHFIFDK